MKNGQNGLRPAHEIMVDQIRQHCEALTAFEETPTSQPSDPDPIELLRLGGLVALLGTLQTMVIPEGRLSCVVEAMEQLPYQHKIVVTTTQSLKRRHEAYMAAGWQPQSQQACTA